MDQALFNQLQRNFKTFIVESANPLVDQPPAFEFKSDHLGLRLSAIAQDIQIKALIDKGLPKEIIQKSLRGKKWGWEVEVKKIVDCEKTFIFGYGNNEIGYKIVFADFLGNEFTCLLNTNFELEAGDKCAIDGNVSEIDPVKKQIRLNRVKVLKGL